MSVPKIAGMILEDEPIESLIAAAQNCVAFALQPETLPVFIAWLMSWEDTGETYDSAMIAADLNGSMRALSRIIEGRQS